MLIHKGVLWCLLFAVFVVAASNFIIPAVVKKMLSRSDPFREVIKSFTDKLGDDIELSYNVGGSSVVGYSLRLTFTDLKVSKADLSLTVGKVIADFPIAQLITKRFKPSSFDFDKVSIYVAPGNATGVLPVMIDNFIRFYTTYEVVPKITIKDAAFSYNNNNIDIPSLIKVRRRLGDRFITVVFNDDAGALRVYVRKYKNFQGNTIKVAYDNVRINQNKVNLLVSGSFNIKTGVDHIPFEYDLIIDKCNGELDFDIPWHIANANAEMVFVDDKIDIGKFGFVVNNNTVSGAALLLLNKDFSIRDADLTVHNNSTIPLYLLKPHFKWKIPDTGYIAGLNVKTVNGKITALNCDFYDVLAIVNDISVSDINGNVELKEDVFYISVNSGRVSDDIRLKDALFNIKKTDDELYVKGTLAANVKTRRVLEYVKNVDHIGDMARRLLDNIADTNLADDSVYLKLAYEGNVDIDSLTFSDHGHLSITWDVISLRDVNISGTVIPFITIRGSIVDGCCDIVAKIGNYSESLRVNVKKDGSISAEFPVSVMYIALPQLEKFFADRMLIAGVLKMEVEKLDSSYKVNVFLDKANINIPVIGLSTNYTGKLRFLLSDTINDLVLTAGAYKATIDCIKVSDDGVSFSNIVLNDKNKVSVEVLTELSVIDVHIKGESLEYKVIDYDFLRGNEARQEKDFRFYVDLNKVYLENGVELNNCKISGYKKKNSDFVMMELGGFFDRGELVYVLRNDLGNMKISTRNAGKFLAGLNITKAISGGNLRLDSEIRNNTQEVKVDIVGFKLTKTPVIARLFSYASLTGLLSALNGTGIYFDTMHVEYNKKKGVVEIKESYAKSEALGVQVRGVIHKNNIDVSGVLSNINILDRALQIIPFYGDIITGGAGGGVLGVNFSMKGDVKDPVISVNPFSILTPGVFKNLFKKKYPIETNPSY